MNFIVKSENDKALNAFNYVKQILEESYKEKYASYVKKLPMLIKNNGMIPTLTFILAKSNGNSDEARAYNKIGEQIVDFLKPIINDINCNDLEQTIIKMIELDSNQNRYILMEIMSLLKWMKRIVEGLIKEA
ncbi:MAG: type III-B CRISPR module-associated protein Cmr5 [bacterium]|nr:type III-B CRISPR module-associated protein Cmr5 [bacterium]